MGVVILGAVALYFLLCVFVVRGAIKHAKKNGKSAKRWGWGAALVLYLIPCWDWLPTVAVHQYYCSSEAGFWVYKSVEQWQVENPGVMGTLVPRQGAPSKREGDIDNFTDTYFLNQRINKVVKFHGKFLFNRWRLEQELVDTKSNEVLARSVDFYTAQIRGDGGWSGWKFWLHNERCGRGANSQHDTYELRRQFVDVEKQLTRRKN